MEDSSSSSESFEDLVQSVGDQVLREKELETEHGNLEFFLCLHGDTTYRIIEELDRPSYSISYVFDLMGAVGNSLEPEDVEDLVGEKPEEETSLATEGENMGELFLDENVEEKIETKLIRVGEGEDLPPRARAGLKVLKAVDEETMDRFTFNLFQELSDPMVSTKLDTSDEGVFKGFEISRRIFPEDDGFSITEFNNSVQAVISQGVFGTNTVNKLLLPEIDLGEEIE